MVDVLSGRPVLPTPAAGAGGSAGNHPGRSLGPHRLSAKRTLDLVVGSIALVLSLPILGIAALATRLSGDPGPVLFRASRVGEGGRSFTIIKLRTMSVTNARVTTVGRVLRRFKIDELPQLMNVLRGDMSLVGPQPEDERSIDWNDPLHRKVFTAKPGITGLAQLKFRSEEPYLAGADTERQYRDRILQSKLRLDSYYLDHESLWLDVRIVARTGIAMVVPLADAFVYMVSSALAHIAPPRARIDGLARALRRTIVGLRGRHLLALDLLGINAAIVLAFVARAGFVAGLSALDTYSPAAFLPIVVRPVVNVAFRLYQRLWRNASMPELTQIIAATFTGTILSMGLLYFVLAPLKLPGSTDFPRSFWIVEGLLSLVFMGATRLAIRAASEGESSIALSTPAIRSSRTILYGAGQAGTMMARSALREPRAGVIPVGFLDDDPSRKGERVVGLPVFGGLDELTDAIALTNAQLLLITMPSAPGPAIRRVTEVGMEAGLEVRTVPDVHELLNGSFDAFRVRRVHIEDLIQRPQVNRLVDQVETIISGETVLVTGAGGSIGSELARQVFAAEPRSLILLDRAESPLYNIQRELEGKSLSKPRAAELDVELANVSSRAAMQRIIDRNHPRVIFHAAAYKHVPLMEAYPSDAVHVNIGGTLSVLDAAVAAGTPHFVLVSTDKAVLPSSVMGATKRIAEWLVADAARLTGHAYVSVRFGNVLGSTGSVVPIFQSQLESGLPITITHPEMTRYFMTIPEATALILEATALGTPGDVFVLDMGEPVRIVDLARDLVRLAGRDPDTVPMVFTGLRPGEKLHEQLYYGNEDVRRTQNEKVMLALGEAPPPGVRQLALDLLALADGNNDDKLRERLFAAVGTRQSEPAIRAGLPIGLSADQPGTLEKQGEPAGVEA